MLIACRRGWLLVRLVLAEHNQRTHHPAGITEEVRIFFLALRKKLFQQWRADAAACLQYWSVWSDVSSAAYSMPEMMKAIPGARQFAGLIPEPQADALVNMSEHISIWISPCHSDRHRRCGW
jgi:hypothetical protein